MDHLCSPSYPFISEMLCAWWIPLQVRQIVLSVSAIASPCSAYVEWRSIQQLCCSHSPSPTCQSGSMTCHECSFLHILRCRWPLVPPVDNTLPVCRHHLGSAHSSVGCQWRVCLQRRPRLPLLLFNWSNYCLDSCHRSGALLLGWPRFRQVCAVLPATAYSKGVAPACNKNLNPVMRQSTCC